MDIPSFNIHRVEKLRDKLLTHIFSPLVGVLVDGTDIAAHAKSLQCRMPSDISVGVLTESIRYIAGAVLTTRDALELAWRLAGNVPQLQLGIPATRWTSQVADEWVVVEVINAVPGRDMKNRLGHTFSFRVLCGTSCPMTIRALWRPELTSIVSRRVGFSRPTKRYRYTNAVDIVGLRFVVKISQAKSQFVPTFYEIADEQPPSIVTWNRTHVLRVRCRVEPCPEGYTHRCSECFVGQDQCKAATHPRTFELRPCGFCGQTEAYFDPVLGYEQCVVCQYKALTARRT